MRIESMVREIGSELGGTAIDEGGAARLTSIHRQVIDDLGQIVSPGVAEELQRLVRPASGAHPDEVAIVQAQLSGWLRGAMQGLKAQAMAAAFNRSPATLEPEPAPSEEEPRERNRKRRHDAAYL